VELSAGLILLKPTVKGFTEHKDLCWFLFYFILFYFILFLWYLATIH
jgi:hypothetical protein